MSNRVNIIFNGNTDWDFNVSQSGNTVPTGTPSSSGGTSCASISQSYCKHTFAAVECLKNIFQGENCTIDIMLADADRVLLDLDDITSIYIILYDDTNSVIADFSYPSVTGDYSIEILQQTVGETLVSRGKISIELTPEMTSNMLSGNLYSEIKLTTATDTFVISCLLLGKIKSSRINQFQLEI